MLSQPTYLLAISGTGGGGGGIDGGGSGPAGKQVIQEQIMIMLEHVLMTQTIALFTTINKSTDGFHASTSAIGGSDLQKHDMDKTRGT